MHIITTLLKLSYNARRYELQRQQLQRKQRLLQRMKEHFGYQQEQITIYLSHHYKQGWITKERVAKELKNGSITPEQYKQIMK